MNGWEYEYYCAGYLRQQGFSSVYVTPGSHDQGVDVIAHKGGFKYAVQCKHFTTSPVGNKAVQEVFTGAKINDCDRCIVITSSTFTKSAREAARKTGVELWEGIVPEGNSVVRRNPVRKGPDKPLILAWIAILAMVFVALVGVFGPKEEPETPAYTAKSPAAEPTEAPAKSTSAPAAGHWEGNVPANDIFYTRSSAKEMLLRLRQDAAAAAETYDGAYVKITGYIAAVDPAGEYVTLEAEQFASSQDAVLCLIQNEEQLRRVESLSVGKYVTVWGLCDADESGFRVQIHCISQ